MRKIEKNIFIRRNYKLRLIVRPQRGKRGKKQHINRSTQTPIKSTLKPFTKIFRDKKPQQ